MVQILSAPQRKPTFGERLSTGVGRGLDIGSQIMGQEAQKKQLENTRKQLSSLTGHDLTDFTPEMLQEVGKLYFQRENQLDLEKLKQGGKQSIQQEKQNFLSQLFGGKNELEEGKEFSNQNQNNPLRQNTNQGMENFDPSKISDEDIARATSIDRDLGRELRYAKDSAFQQKRHKEDLQQRDKEFTRKEETEISKPVLIEMNQVRKNIPLQEQAILDIQEASPKVSGLDYIADITGFEPFRSAEGAKLKTGIKDFFLSDLTRVGARPNQWIEQQLADALPKIGRSKEANLITAEGMKFKVDLAKKRMESIDDLAEEDRKKYGYVKGDIDSRAYKDMKKYVIDRQKVLQENIKKIKADNKGKKNVARMISPEGSVYEVSSDDIDEALGHGYELTE